MEVDRLVVVALVVAGAMAVALVAQRRRPDAPTQARWSVPSQIDRSDFTSPDVPWLVVVFTSTTCGACVGTVAKTEVMACDEVAVTEVEVGENPALHRRYDIDVVPTMVIADGQGVVRASFVGPPVASELWAAMADLREDAGRGLEG